MNSVERRLTYEIQMNGWKELTKRNLNGYHRKACEV